MITDFTKCALSPEGWDAKEAMRRIPLDTIKHSSYLWGKDGLRYDWMELAGDDAPTLDLLLRERALGLGLGNAKFIGVDTNANAIQRCRTHFGPTAPAEWVHDKLKTLMCQNNAFQQVGVLVYDTENGTWRENWAELDYVCAFARRQADLIGEFCLVVNVVGGRLSTPSAVKSYCTRLSKALDHEVTPNRLHTYTSKTTPMLWTMVTIGF